MQLLDYALFAMDVYRRGPGQNLPTVPGVTKFNDATIIAQDGSLTGFYSVAYDVGDKIVISYRGTDSILNDGPTGWLGAVGLWYAPQNLQAISFYHQIRDLKLDKPIMLTGHSLGGGLAGFVSNITGEEAYVFDNMTYSLSSAIVYIFGLISKKLFIEPSQGILELSNKFVEIFNEEIKNIEYLRNFSISKSDDGNFLIINSGLSMLKLINMPINEIINTLDVFNYFYKDIDLYPYFIDEKVTIFAADGEILEILRTISLSDFGTNYYSPYFGGEKREDFFKSSLNKNIKILLFKFKDKHKSSGLSCRN